MIFKCNDIFYKEAINLGMQGQNVLQAALHTCALFWMDVTKCLHFQIAWNETLSIIVFTTLQLHSALHWHCTGQTAVTIEISIHLFFFF